MKISVKIKHNKNGEQTLTTKPADLIKWERLTKSKMTDLIEVRKVDGGEDIVEMNLGFEDLAVMAWAVLYRAGETSDKFDLWADGLDEVELAGIDEPNPPQAEASDTQSPSLPSQE